MTNLKAALAITVLASSAAQADAMCHELWYARNFIFDQSGYCFGSKLGQAVFDNADCITKSPKLSAEDKAEIARIKALETENQCRVDSSATALNIEGLDLRKWLYRQPLPADFESACIGWLGETRSLWRAPEMGGPASGVFLNGDTLGTAHESVGGFEFYHVYRDGQLMALGWVEAFDWGINCRMVAG